MAQGTLPWVRLYINNRAAFDAMDNAKIGGALKAALRYADGGQDENIGQSITDIETRIAFELLKKGVDDSVAKHAERVESGKKGAEVKREKAKAMQAAIDNLQAKYGGDEPTPAEVNLS